MQPKKYYRETVQAIVNSRTAEDLAECSGRVVLQLKAIPQLLRASCIMLYYPLSDEVNILSFAEESLVSGKRVCFPVCVQKSRSIRVKEVISLTDDFALSPYCNLYEPLENCRELSPSDVDAAVVPGRAFDRHGCRVGRGRGYYDNFLAGGSFTTIAAAFSFQVFDRVPCDSHDIPLDYIATEETVITCTPGPAGE